MLRCAECGNWFSPNKRTTITIEETIIREEVNCDNCISMKCNNQQDTRNDTSERKNDWEHGDQDENVLNCLLPDIDELSAHSNRKRPDEAISCGAQSSQVQKYSICNLDDSIPSINTEFMERELIRSDNFFQNEITFETTSRNINNDNMNLPYVEITEQPKPMELRFRYQCEGRLSGTLKGISSSPSRRSYPTIRISNCTGRAIVTVSCVTSEPPYR